MTEQSLPKIEFGDINVLKWKASPWAGVSYKWMRIGPGGYDVVDLLRVEEGVSLFPHRHSSPQSSYLVSGRVRAMNGEEMEAGSWIHIPAGLRHGHVALEEATWVDFFPGLLTWFLDDGSVFSLKANGDIVKRGVIGALGEESMI
jgi:hypothetical protein